MAAPVVDSGRSLTMARAGREAVISAMRRNPDIFVIGEDIAKLGGVFGTTVGMAEEFGSQRIVDTPISETGFIGIATGAAMAGMHPIIEIAFVDFIGVCYNQIVNFAAKTHYMSGGQFKVPMTMMIGYGGGYCDAAQHSQTLIATLAHMPGIKVITPADAYDAKGLMASCLADDNLCVWMVHKAIWGLGWLGLPIKTALATVPEEDYTVPFGKARIWREGKDVTLVGYGITVHHSLAAAEKLAAEGISAEVLDLRTIVPMDREAVFKSVAKTGRLVVADEDYMNCGVTAEILAIIAERDPRVLKAPAVRVANPDVPIPFSRPMENFALPDADKIVAAAKKTMGESMTDVVVPQDLWDTEDEGVLLTWVYSDGALVQQGKLLAELMVEKAQLELEAPASGRLRILVQPDAVIKKGQVLARIEPV